MKLTQKEKKIFRAGVCVGYKKSADKQGLKANKPNKPKYEKGQKFDASSGRFEIVGYDPVRADSRSGKVEYSYRVKTSDGTYSSKPDWEVERLIKLGRYVPVKEEKNKKQIRSY